MPVTKAHDLIKDSKPIYARPGETVLDAAKRMAEFNIGSLPIVDSKMKVIGIFTERDLVRLVAKGVDVSSTKLEEVMTRNVVTAGPEDPLPSLAHKMIKHGIRHLPIVDSEGRLLGVVSMRKVLQYILAGSEWP